MGLRLIAKDFTAAFHELEYTPILANDLDLTTKEGKKEYDRLVTLKFEGDTLELVPQCSCGSLSGGALKGYICRICNTEVEDSGDPSLSSRIWMECTPDVRGFIHPLIYTMLEKQLAKPAKNPDVNILKWLIDPMYKPKKTNKGLDFVIKKGLKRGMNNFIDNFDEIFEVITSASCMVTPETRKHIKTMIKNNRHILFPKYLPIPSRVGFISEHNDSGIYVDSTMDPALDAIQTCSTASSRVGQSVYHNEKRMARISGLMATYYSSLYSYIIGTKKGDLRKTVFGHREDWTFRAVINSLTGIHRPDEIHIPWPMAITLFGLHIKNKLYRRGYTPVSAATFLKQHLFKVHPLLQDIFTEILSEPGEKHGGYPCVFQRN